MFEQVVADSDRLLGVAPEHLDTLSATKRT